MLNSTVSFGCSWECADICDEEIQLWRTRQQSPSQRLQRQVSNDVAKEVSVL